MQKLALMMAVMMLDMPPVSGHYTDMGSKAQGERGRAQPMFYPSTWIENGKVTLVAGKGAMPAAPHKDSPVEPGGQSALRILQQVQLGMESLSKIRAEIQGKEPEVKRTSGRKDWNPGSGGSGLQDRPKREAAQKAMDALKKGADATRGRGRRKGRMYQRAGIRN